MAVTRSIATTTLKEQAAATVVACWRYGIDELPGTGGSAGLRAPLNVSPEVGVSGGGSTRVDIGSGGGSGRTRVARGGAGGAGGTGGSVGVVGQHMWPYMIIAWTLSGGIAGLRGLIGGLGCDGVGMGEDLVPDQEVEY
ncbi:uncharacterized protein PG998_013020 [Apiospora kogelbergensis]|uniref:uncharacterized protein n=1 Tax=Apiospora kogelbergensis TaxID=1337665 RepID=UPI0031306F75